ncbi:hypothetical protein SAMN04488128_105139 [Chitinophaga eiseniae]|uniref:DUF928 domain-containing protein n=1 Tax=Chitinophaga eiseniae TaxID=634771 RepID=A0A1T4TID9_9BACT|nr:hypothetical protein [Chitinophaga eiseniae]SKA40197.1 hypothetical protein SAMN04488128_105139 [Chitinophaga eiseniae]
MPRKIYALLICMGLFLTETFAQVSMTVQLPPVGVLVKPQLWNLVLVNAGNRPAAVRVLLRLSDAGTTQPVLTAVTRTVVLTPGANQLQEKDLAPVQYEYLVMTTDRRPEGLLSPGSYLACYSVVLDGDKAGQPATEDCIPFTVEPLSPPLLNMPTDASVLEQRLPQFTWIPPAPLQLFTDLNYELVVTEKREGQSAAEAVQTNIPVYRASALRQIFAAYPSGGVPLDTGRTYAWTVKAYNGRQFAAQTEIWTFRLNSKALMPAYNSPYVSLKREVDGVVTNCGNVLRFAYTNETAEADTRYSIISLDNGNREIMSGTITLQPGNNLLELKLRRSGKLKTGAYYALILQNSRDERWRMNFTYNPEENTATE